MSQNQRDMLIAFKAIAAERGHAWAEQWFADHFGETQARALRDPMGAIRPLLDADQGVDMDGRPCWLVWDPDGRANRSSGTEYIGPPLFRDALTVEDIDKAERLGAHPHNIQWARSTLADRQPVEDDPSVAHEGVYTEGY